MPQRSRSRREADGLADLDVHERRLDNGMVLLVAPRRQSPVVVCDLYYDAGSARDPAGQTGIAHFLEHMLFKGTDRFPKGAIDQLTFRSAGVVNAETGDDLVHYWFELPAGCDGLALAIESDRMTGAIFDPGEVERERRVILEERAGEMDSPLARLDRAHRAMSYLNHPYRNPILGWPDDFRDLGADKLERFYRDHYAPGRAILVMAGDVDPDAALDRASAAFGGVARGGEAALPPSPEPAQLGRRDFRLEDGDFITRGLFGWHTVPAGHGDASALSVAADIFGGGKRSRLWDRLVERDRIATDVDVFHEPARWGGQFLVAIDLAARTDIRRAESAILEEIDRLAEEGPTSEELARVRNRLEAGWRWSRLDPASVASGLGQAALAGDWRQWLREIRQTRDVAMGDVRRVVGRYLIESNLTLGWSVPGNRRVISASPQRSSPLLEPEHTIIAPLAPDWGIASSRTGLKDYCPARSVFPDGLRLVVDPVEGSGVVALDLYCDAGQLREETPGLANLVGRMLEEGAAGRDARELAEAVERLGGTIETHATGLSLRMRSEDFPLALEIAADIARRPLFPDDLLDWTKSRVRAEIRADREDPAFRAEEAFRRLVYGPEHPYGRDPRGNARTLAEIGLSDIREHHRRWFRPNNAILVLSGEFGRDPRRLVERTLLRGWEPGPIPPLVFSEPRRARIPRVKRIVQEGDQVQVVMGHLGIPRQHPDFDALCLLDLVLGGAGLTDRLNRRIREELGLAYSIAGTMTDSADRGPGTFRVAFGTSPDRLDLALAAVRGEIAAVRAGEFGDEEVEAARAYLLSAWVFDFVAVDQRCERLLDLERLGLGPDAPICREEILAAITPDRVRAAARAHLDPDRLLCAICGPLA